MVWYPCCRQPLEVWCKLIAAFQVVVPILTLGNAVHGLTALLKETDPPSEMTIVLKVIEIVSMVLQFLFGFVLGVGAWKRNAKFCWTWVGFSSLHLLLVLVLIICESIRDRLQSLGESTSFARPILIVLFLVCFPFQCYIIYVVYAFIVEMRGRQRQLVRPELEGSNAVATPAPPQSDWSILKNLETPTTTESEQTLKPPKP